MSEDRIITEQDLLHEQDKSGPHVSSTGLGSPMLACAGTTAGWLIDGIARGRNPTAADTREFFESQLKRTQYAIPPQEYAIWLAQIPHVCWRLRDILWSREILQPIRRYKLILGGVTVVGEYAVLRSSRKPKHAQVLYLRHGGVRRRPLVPDLVSFARALEINNRWTVVSREWGVSSCGVLHHWLEADFTQEHRPDPGVVRQVLLDAVAVVGRDQPADASAALSRVLSGS